MHLNPSQKLKNKYPINIQQQLTHQASQCTKSLKDDIWKILRSHGPIGTSNQQLAVSANSGALSNGAADAEQLTFGSF